MKVRAGAIAVFGIGVALGALSIAVDSHAGAANQMAGLNCRGGGFGGGPGGTDCPLVENTSRARSLYAPSVWLWALSGTPTAQICLQSQDDVTFSCGASKPISGSIGVPARYVVSPTDVPANWNNSFWGFAVLQINGSAQVLGYVW